MISRVYGELFEWVRQLVSISESECFCEPYIICVCQMENYLQEEFEMLMKVVSILPGNAVLPVVPFISLVFKHQRNHQSSSGQP
jgi:hypothetical protein